MTRFRLSTSSACKQLQRLRSAIRPNTCNSIPRAKSSPSAISKGEPSRSYPCVKRPNSIASPDCTNRHNMTFSPDGKSLYVGNLGANFVSVINVESAELTEQIPVGSGRATASLDAHDEHQGIIDVTASPDGSLGFAAFGDGDTLGVFDLRTSERIASRPTGDLPWRAYPSANGAYMIVPNNGDRTVSIFEAGALFEEVARVDGAEGMTGVNTSHDTAFVIARGGEEIVVIDLENLETVGTIALPGASPETGVLTPDGEKLYVALSGADAVAVIDVEQREISKRIENVGEGPWGAFLLNADNYCH